MLWKECAERSEAWQERERTEHGTFTSTATTCGTTGKPERTSTAKAEASHTNRGTVERMDRLARERPDLAKKVKRGERYRLIHVLDQNH